MPRYAFARDEERDLDWREIQRRAARVGYVVDPDFAMAVVLMRRLQRPLLIEGEAGVGKTDAAKALAEILSTKLIRLQCYEGLDANAAVYEWNYQRQLLAIKIRENEALSAKEKEAHIFTEDFLLRRPLLQAIASKTPPVLLIDEIDRADEEFEAYLLEVLSDYQISIPELGTIEAVSIPHVVLTSNATRELSDALRRRCLYFYLDFPDEAKELQIVAARVPDIEQKLGRPDRALRAGPAARGPGKEAGRGGNTGLGAGAARPWRGDARCRSGRAAPIAAVPAQGRGTIAMR